LELVSPLALYLEILFLLENKIRVKIKVCKTDLIAIFNMLFLYVSKNMLQ